LNNPPTINDLDGDTLVYGSGAGVMVIDQTVGASIDDPEDTGFDTAEVTVSITTGRDPAEDELSVRNQGGGGGQIGFVGATVSYEGTNIGTATGGSDVNDLVITLNAAATETAVGALLQNITYENTLQINPLTRTVQFTVSDELGAPSDNNVATIDINFKAWVSKQIGSTCRHRQNDN
jgi:hypothetical protein